MKNDFGTKDSSSRMKGFYLALLSCVGILVVVAIAINYNNSAETKGTNDGTASTRQANVRDVNIGAQESIEGKDNSYVAAPDNTAGTSLSARNDKPAETPAPSKAPEPNADSSNKDSSKPPEAKPEEKAPEQSGDGEKKAESTDNENVSGEVDSSAVQEEANSETGQEEANAETGQEGASTETDQEGASNDSAQESANAETSSFLATGKMNWPVIGEILMDYSVDTVVFDKTLELFRTNDSIAIQSHIGAEVKAAADGVVQSIAADERDGQKVVIDNGDGWLTTYSQLQDDNILVKEGDVVKAGQVIGSVGAPTKYNVLLGSHLNFKVSKNDQAVDPKSILTQ
ncbi:MAG: peptidoglycan DD-metalloendopeptidase family protein [Clostridiales bacterium]|jgi:murein DD-endopeptidase MepM/ murein hydrolase activator NlpD|nr:peptidoglycan DD-metalloendopeptidase family protein [Clostridiales bacterium]